MLKLWYERARPDVTRLVTATGYSFPSGHTMNATAFLGFIAYVTITEERISLHKKLLIILIASFVVLSISVSRIYLGVHFPSDILAGWATGGSWLVLCVIFHKAFIKKNLCHNRFFFHWFNMNVGMVNSEFFRSMASMLSVIQ